MTLSTGHEPFCLSLCHTMPHPAFAHCNSAHLLSTALGRPHYACVSLCPTQTIVKLGTTMLPHHEENVIVPNCLLPLGGLLVGAKLHLVESYLPQPHGVGWSCCWSLLASGFSLNCYSLEELSIASCVF